MGTPKQRTNNTKTLNTNVPLRNDKRDLDSIINSEQDLDMVFSSETNQSQDQARELFSIKQIRARTDISKRQVVKVTKVDFWGKVTQSPDVNDIVENFLTLRISSEGKSRSQFVDVLKGMSQKIGGMFNNIRDQFNK